MMSDCFADLKSKKTPLQVVAIVLCAQSLTTFCFAQAQEAGCNPKQYLGDDGVCRNCTTCPAGFEPSLNCQAEKSPGECRTCENGFYQQENDSVSPCQYCAFCLHQKMLMECTPVSNTVCGDCQQGFGQDKDGNCQRCALLSDAQRQGSKCDKDKHITTVPPTQHYPPDADPTPPYTPKQDEVNRSSVWIISWILMLCVIISTSWFCVWKKKSIRALVSNWQKRMCLKFNPVATNPDENGSRNDPNVEDGQSSKSLLGCKDGTCDTNVMHEQTSVAIPCDDNNDRTELQMPNEEECGAPLVPEASNVNFISSRTTARVEQEEGNSAHPSQGCAMLQTARCNNCLPQDAASVGDCRSRPNNNTSSYHNDTKSNHSYLEMLHNKQNSFMKLQKLSVIHIANLTKLLDNPPPGIGTIPQLAELLKVDRNQARSFSSFKMLLEYLECCHPDITVRDLAVALSSPVMSQNRAVKYLCDNIMILDKISTE